MKASVIYRKAAKKIDEEFTACSCDAVTNVIRGGNIFGASKEANSYAELFCPDHYTVGIWGREWSDEPQERKQCRVLALLFMSEIARSEE